VNATNIAIGQIKKSLNPSITQSELPVDAMQQRFNFLYAALVVVVKCIHTHVQACLCKKNICLQCSTERRFEWYRFHIAFPVQ